MYLNKVFLIGKVIKLPEIRAVGNSSVANFYIMTNDTRAKKDGTIYEEKCSVGIEAWGKYAELSKGLVEGDDVCIEGRLKQNTWENKATGSTMHKHVVIPELLACDRLSKSSGDKEPSERLARPEIKPVAGKPVAGKPVTVDELDVPF